MQKLALDASSLRQRAMQCRHLADSMKDREIGEKLRRIANEYDSMAASFAVPNKAPIVTLFDQAAGIDKRDAGATANRPGR
jgi:hypothetical protein